MQIWKEKLTPVLQQCRVGTNFVANPFFVSTKGQKIRSLGISHFWGWDWGWRKESFFLM